MADDTMSPHGEALISEYQERGWRERVRLIANYDYQGVCSGNALWWQMTDVAMLAMSDKEEERDYRQIAIDSPMPWGPLV